MTNASKFPTIGSNQGMLDLFTRIMIQKCLEFSHTLFILFQIFRLFCTAFGLDNWCRIFLHVILLLVKFSIEMYQMDSLVVHLCQHCTVGIHEFHSKAALDNGIVVCSSYVRSTQTEWQIFDIHLYAWNFPFWWLYENNSARSSFSSCCTAVWCFVVFYRLSAYIVCIWYGHIIIIISFFAFAEHFCALTVLRVLRQNCNLFSRFATKMLLPPFSNCCPCFSLSIPLLSSSSVDYLLFSVWIPIWAVFPLFYFI